MHSYAEKIAAVGAAANPTFQTLGITPVSWGNDAAVLKLTVRPAIHNGVGFLQGGFYVILADEAIALAILAGLDPESGITTVSETTEFIRGVKDGEIFAVARIIRKGRRIVFAESEVHAAAVDGPLLSRTTASYLITS